MTSKKSIKNNKAIAAIVAARARIKLYHLIHDISKWGQILYLDTDEVFVKPRNWCEFFAHHSTWSYYNSIEFWCERNYEGYTILNEEVVKGTLRHAYKSFRRPGNGLGTTRPTHIDGKTLS